MILLSLTGLLRFLVTIAVIYLCYKIFVRLILPFLLALLAKKMQNKMQETIKKQQEAMQEQMHQQQNPGQQKPKNNAKGFDLDSDGEFVDYEEIKD